MDRNLLRAELERVFGLNELLRLSRELLGFDPEQVGGSAALGSFAAALVDYCVEQDAVEALCEAVLATKTNLHPSLQLIRNNGLRQDVELRPGEELGGILLERKLGEGRVGVVYAGKQGERRVRLKLLRREATRDRRGLHRFLTISRLVGTIRHPGLPTSLVAGAFGSCFGVQHDYVDGDPLQQRLAQGGPVHIEEARPWLEQLLEALAALHDRRLSHGDLRLENVLVRRDATGSHRLMLLDAGSDRLRARARIDEGQRELYSTVSSPHTVAPEQIRDGVSHPRSDVYSFGALAYELLSGKPAHGPGSALESAIRHLVEPVKPPSRVAPHGWIPPELDEWVVTLLQKDPSRRPKDARAALALLEALGSASRRFAVQRLAPEELEELTKHLAAEPASNEAALALERAVERGADVAVVAAALKRAAAGFESVDERTLVEVKKGLLFRAARLYEHRAKDLSAAEATYLELVKLDREDEVASSALEEVRRALGKYDELVEMLLARSEQAETAAGRARCLAQVGRIYARDLDDREQALVAYTQALCADPTQPGLSDEIEVLAASSRSGWSEVLDTLREAADSSDAGPERRTQILLIAARWYETKLARPDRALTCYQDVAVLEPASEAALSGTSRIFRKGEQWPELVVVLERRATSAPTPAEARDRRAEAALIFEQRLHNRARARELYEQVLGEDPGHDAAGEGLARLCEAMGDYPAEVLVLEQRAAAQRGEERLKTLCRIAELYDEQLDDPNQAKNRFEAVLAEDANHQGALRGLERLYAKTGRYQDLLENLETQIRLALTPRQKLLLWERVATLHEQEFLDHARSAESLRQLLQLDPTHERALHALLRNYRALERFDEVDRVYERLLQLATDPQQKAELSVARAHVLAERLGSPERAIRAYERALEWQPQYAPALQALARLRETMGDTDAALRAIEALAQAPSSPQQRRELHLRAAKLLESRGDRDGAIEHYEGALDAEPGDATVGRALVEAHLARGDAPAALRVLERLLEHTEGNHAKAKLASQMAVLYHTRSRDDERAERAARHALTLDPLATGALLVASDIAFERGRYAEAIEHYAALATRTDWLDRETAVRVLTRYVDVLTKTGTTQPALGPIEALLRIAPDDPAALARVAQVTFEHGSPERAAELYDDLLSHFGELLSDRERATAQYRYGEALRRSGQLREAIGALEDAAELDPQSPLPLASLAAAYQSQRAWEKALAAKARQLPLVEGEERVQLHLDMGELAATQLGDRTRAAQSLVAALELKPDDRRLLTRLMQLYSEEKDWNKLTEIVLRLADFVDDPKQKAKYLHTAAIVCAKQLQNTARALALYEQVLELDPQQLGALNEAIELERSRRDHEGEERLLQRRLSIATQTNDQALLLATFTELGELYEKKLAWRDQAIDAYEAAQTVDPDDLTRQELLADLYASDPARYLDKSVAAHAALLKHNPYRAESYKALRRLYTDTKRADAAWCVCQALWTLNLAEPDEERFFRRLRSESPAPAQAVLRDEDWLGLLLHPDAEPLLTSVFALIEPTVIATRSQSLDELGYDARYALDLASHPSPICQTVFWASSVLGLSPPLTFERPDHPGGLSFLHAHTPALVLGQAALAADPSPQTAAFVAGRHLTYYRPGLYLRHLVASGTGLKSWLFAAVKLIAPQFPVAADLEGPVRENLRSLEAGMQRAARDQLARIVSKLLQQGAALDLRRWITAIDWTADRAGFVLAHDLPLALELIRAEGEVASQAPTQERVKELLQYAVSEPYLMLRRQLGIAIDD